MKISLEGRGPSRGDRDLFRMRASFLTFSKSGSLWAVLCFTACGRRIGKDMVSGEVREQYECYRSLFDIGNRIYKR